MSARTATKRKPAKEIGYTNYSRAEVRKLAAPEQIGTAFVWWASGGDGWGADPARGIIPWEMAHLLPPGTFPPIPGNGGKWYRTRGEAMRALATALDGVPFDASGFEDIGAGI